LKGRAPLNETTQRGVYPIVKEDDDVSLVQRSLAGDAEAYSELVRRHLNSAYAVALSELGDSRDAEDAAQDTFIQALQRLEECRDPSKFGAWVRTIARNRARSLGRRKRVRQAEPLETAYEAASTADPSKDMERTQLRAHLESALATLKPVQRQVIVLHDLEGMKHGEIALDLGIPEGTVRSHLHFARRALRELLGGIYRRGELDDRTD
jgi:RNA polymerase sigma-70 factor (ECF subfamily)